MTVYVIVYPPNNSRNTPFPDQASDLFHILDPAGASRRISTCTHDENNELVLSALPLDC